MLCIQVLLFVHEALTNVMDMLRLPVGEFSPRLLTFYDSGHEPFAAVLGLSPSGLHGEADIVGVIRQHPGSQTFYFCPRGRHARTLPALSKNRDVVWCYRLVPMPQ